MQIIVPTMASGSFSLPPAPYEIHSASTAISLADVARRLSGARSRRGLQVLYLRAEVSPGLTGLRKRASFTFAKKKVPADWMPILRTPDAAALEHRLEQDDPGHDRIAGEVAFEEILARAGYVRYGPGSARPRISTLSAKRKGSPVRQEPEDLVGSSRRRA